MYRRRPSEPAADVVVTALARIAAGRHATVARMRALETGNAP
jgi:hypothetical protein